MRSVLLAVALLLVPVSVCVVDEIETSKVIEAVASKVIEAVASVNVEG